MNIRKITDTDCVRDLFSDWEETLIWSCLQGVMGEIYGGYRDRPVSAMALLGDFCFFTGEVSEELVRFKPELCEQAFVIMVPQNQEWGAAIEAAYGADAKKVTRYAIKKEPGIFDKKYLEQIVSSVPEGYSLQRMDKSLYEKCKSQAWSADLVSLFESCDEYAGKGIGYVITKDGEVVSGASSYSVYKEGIEIEIDTKEEYRRQGFALICGARLILECLGRGLYPSWDAQNKWSVALAEKLGYHFSHEYTAYEVNRKH